MDALARSVIEAGRERVQEVVSPRPSPQFYDADFAEQRAFLEDDSPLKLVFCTRRAGKSYGEGLQLFRDIFNTPGATSLYIAKTRDSAKKILWKDVLKPINRQLGLKAKPNLSELSWTLPTGGVLYILGADADDEEKDKLLGQKYRTVVIDEAEAWRTDLNALVFEILKPAVADYRGQIIMSGTPSDVKAGLFYELTKDQDASVPGRWKRIGGEPAMEWSCHRWSTFQNPHMREKWAAEIAELKVANPRIEETPRFRRMYLGQWAIDDSKLVYKYSAGRNDFVLPKNLDELLPAHVKGRGRWHYVLGVDLGFNDDCSFTLGAYHDFDRTLFGIFSRKEPGLDITATSERINKIRSDYDVDRVQIDGANKQAVMEMNRRHGVGAHPADKKEKPEFIDLMNAEYIQGRIKLSEDCEPLKEEYAGLIWDERALETKRKREEHPSCANHCADGWLYAWRYCFQYLSDTVAPPLAEGSPEWLAQREAEVREQAEEELRIRQDIQRESGFGKWDEEGAWG